jgi:hypothetical protein
MFMPKRLAMLAVTAAVALVPATAAEASVPSNPQPMPLKPCVVKWIQAPTTHTIAEQAAASAPTVDSFDVENQYADSGADDGTVAHDDMTYDGC